MGKTDGVGLIVYVGTRAELEAKLRRRDDRITELEAALDDLVMEAGLGASGADWEQAINRARDLLKSSSRAE